MRLDSHQHFWKFDPVRDAWIDDSMQIIQRDFLPEDLAPILKQNDIDGCVAVQADQSEKETEFLLNLSDKNSFIKAVVGWVDLRADNIEDRLTFFSTHNKLKGMRHIVQAEANDFMLDASFQYGISLLDNFNLTYDILVFPSQLPAAIALVKKFPKQKFVLDHIAKPLIKDQIIGNWKNDIEVLSSFENVYCKVSGMVTEADWKDWESDHFKVYLDVVFQSFGVDRIMYGSDWPVCLVAAQYQEQMSIVTSYISKLSETDQNKIMGLNAVNFYNI